LSGYDKSYGNVNRSSDVHSNHGAEEYEVQYDPNNDFAIFGIGDKTRGGIQNLKEKMNLADGVKGEEYSSSDEDSDRVQRKDSDIRSTQVQTNIQPSSRGSKNPSHDEFRSSSAGNSSLDSNTKMVENDLAEDKEFMSDVEEEEEE
jgi:hypothetical protein